MLFLANRLIMNDLDKIVVIYIVNIARLLVGLELINI